MIEFICYFHKTIRGSWEGILFQHPLIGICEGCFAEVVEFLLPVHQLYFADPVIASEWSPCPGGFFLTGGWLGEASVVALLSGFFPLKG